MKLFRWYSDAMADYSDGSIVTIANTVKQARTQVLKVAADRAGAPDGWLALVQSDLAKDPDVIESNVLFIKGSA